MYLGALASTRSELLDRAFVMAGASVTMEIDPDSPRPGPDVGACTSNDDDVENREDLALVVVLYPGEEATKVAVRRGEGYWYSPGRVATRSRSELDGSLWHLDEVRLGWSGDDVLRGDRQDETFSCREGSVAAIRPREAVEGIGILFRRLGRFCAGEMAGAARACAGSGVRRPSIPVAASTLEEPAPGPSGDSAGYAGTWTVIIGSRWERHVRSESRGILLVEDRQSPR